MVSEMDKFMENSLPKVLKYGLVEPLSQIIPNHWSLLPRAFS